LAAYRDWDRQSDFRTFVKMRLLDVDPAFIDHFVNLVEDYHKVKLKKAEQLELGLSNPADRHLQEPPAEVRPKYPDNTPLLEAPHQRKPELKRVRKNGLRVTPNGTLITQKHSLKVHVPEIAHSAAPYFQILYPTKADGLTDEKRAEFLEKVHKPWLRAMSHWTTLNDMLRDGKLPESVVYHAGMFSAMSPNTTVPLQELYYGHIMDLMNKHGFDPREPVHADHVRYLKEMISGARLPEWNRAHYEGKGHKEGEGARYVSENDSPQILGFSNYNAFHPYMMDLIQHHRDDGQQIAASLMHMKNVADRAAKNRKSVNHATMRGFGIKLARYTIGMMGAGNVLVPDRHFMRAMFNISPVTGGDKLNHLTNVFEEPTAEKAMRAIDQFFFEHHPAVQYTLNKFPEHFKGREQQALFPAFWLHWLATPHYEAAQGFENENAQNVGADHMPFWESIRPDVERVMRNYNVPFDEGDSSFAFGHNLNKSETPATPLAMRTAHAMKEIEDRFGPTAAQFAFHSYMVPVLFRANYNYKRPDFSKEIMKAQSLTIDLKKALADFKNTAPSGVYKLYNTDETEPRLVARFAIHDDQIQILEDTGILKPYFSDGIVTQKVYDGLAAIRKQKNLKLVTVAEENSSLYPEEEQVIPKLPDRATAYYEFRIRGLATKHVLEVKGNHVKYDGRSLTTDEIHTIMDDVRSGIASLRLLPSPNMLQQKVAKTEKAMESLFKTEPRREPLETTSNGLGNLYAWAMFKEKPPEGGVYAELNANDTGKINQTHGFVVGDKAIEVLGTTILDTVRQLGKKCKAFRGEADRFYVWFSAKELATQFCRTLRNKLESIPSIRGTHNLTACIGLGETPEKAHEAQEKAKSAKYARYKDSPHAEQHVYSLIPGSEGAVPVENLPPLVKPEDSK
jgi:hypothetical protein